MNVTEKLDELLAKRILILDGAMGTMIQRHKLEAVSYTHLTLPTILRV